MSSYSGQFYKELQDTLIDAFPEKSSLEQMLWFELDKKLDVIAGGEGNYRVVVFKLIKIAEAENWVEGLIDAARKSNPGNPKLKNVAKKILGFNPPSNEVIEPQSSVAPLVPSTPPRSEPPHKTEVNTQNRDQHPTLSEIPVIGDKASEVGADYTKLRDHLENKEFGLADDETVRKMLWVARQEEEGWLEEEHILNFPSRDLLTINQLWLFASKEKFGFSVQKQIWNSRILDDLYFRKFGIRSSFLDFYKFIHKVEWSDNKIVFDQRAVKGHLPYGVYVIAGKDFSLMEGLRLIGLELMVDLLGRRLGYKVLRGLKVECGGRKKWRLGDLEETRKRDAYLSLLSRKDL